MSPTTPKVSILLPNLNSRPFLEERIRTIEEQTLGDWELIVVDNFSDDGAWEFFRAGAARDPRWKISQAPRRGMYANWNNCVRLAAGEYVYIATSDDTMAPTLLERMAAALDEHPECDLAHCKLKIIDEKGNPHPDLNWDRFYCAAYFGDWINRTHIRRAPHDGLLHCGLRTVYTSITQLLIRRTLFDRVGLFMTDCGSIADFEWGMRASLLADTIHIPAYLATWRVHGGQETDLAFLRSAECALRLAALVGRAFRRARSLSPSRLRGIRVRDLRRLYLLQGLRADILARRGERGRMSFLGACGVGLKWMGISPGSLRDVLVRPRGASARAQSESLLDPLRFNRDLLERYEISGHVEVLE
jgi:glycosyltransferase involved in cell wall biosynthesis